MTVPLYNLTDTWNDSGTTFTAMKMNITNTASAGDSKLIDCQLGGTPKFYVDKWGFGYFVNIDIDGNNSLITMRGSAPSITFNEAAIIRDGAANILAQRNGTNPQTFRVYNTFTDSSK